MMKKNGYALLEAVFSLGLFSLIFLSVSTIIFNATSVNNKISNGQDKLENVRLGHYFLCEQMRCADKIKIITDKNFTLKSINTYILDDNKIFKSKHTFAFKDKTIKFGGTSDSGTSFNNELAQNISDLKMEFDSSSNLLRIKIVTDDLAPLYFILYLPNQIVEFKTI